MKKSCSLSSEEEIDLDYMSFRFGAFFVMVLFLFYLIPKGCRMIVLLATSLLFYISSDVRFLIHLMFVAGTSFFAAKAIEKRKNEKLYLFMGIAADAGLWFAVKDLMWFVNGTIQHLGLMQSEWIAPAFLMVVPIGISYYTLQAIGYMVDVYRRKTNCEQNFLKYLLFLS